MCAGSPSSGTTPTTRRRRRSFPGARSSRRPRNTPSISATACSTTYTRPSRSSRTTARPPSTPCGTCTPTTPTRTPSTSSKYFFGPSILVSPVTDEDATKVRIYIPKDIFYELEIGKAVRAEGGAPIQLRDIPFDRIPLHVRGGCIVPMRVASANTTTKLHNKAFELLVAPGLLLRDDGE